ncbi:hypothetical protein FHS32_006462 [Streptomyces albaduncus]|uniref:Uncharacterized protein n=1 Tax=Streptomyces griseoloalbus TaxID=67303 RepID=A0A7W8BU54_9ACTN|nr:hypothetical protein [Streptomyces albaduncus]GGW81788.1 hypothetical protein GCM10010340_69810 [Streptomyces albaduncus]
MDGFLAEAALDYRHLATADGRLGLWEPRHVEEVLLSWLPQQVTELPGEERADAPGTLRTLLRYLHAAQLADPRGPSLQDSLAAVDRVAIQHPVAMTDRTRWGLAKFWAMTAAEQGVHIQDGAAFQRFADRAQRGEVAYDQQALAAIMERRLTGRALSDGARAEPQLPVMLPPDDELRRRAEASTTVEQLRGLAEWAGQGGSPVTATGRLRMAEARELVDVLGTGDRIEGVRSSADLPRLGLLVEWAKKARLVRVVKGRLYRLLQAARQQIALGPHVGAELLEVRVRKAQGLGDRVLEGPGGHVRQELLGGADGGHEFCGTGHPADSRSHTHSRAGPRATPRATVSRCVHMRHSVLLGA